MCDKLPERLAQSRIGAAIGSQAVSSRKALNAWHAASEAAEPVTWYALSSSWAIRQIKRQMLCISSTLLGLKMLADIPSEGLSSDISTGIPPT
eukprot:scaffold223642_cov41-Prasinocladus_malaysianus.AAC.2